MAASNFRLKSGIEIEGSVATTLILNGTADPTSGLVGDVGSIYMRDNTGTDGGELYLKFGELNTDWTLFASETGGAASLEDSYQNSYTGKSADGSEMPTYSSTNHVTTTTDSLEDAIGILDAEIGADLTANTRTTGAVSAGNTVNANVEALDDAVGADSEITALTRTVGPVSVSQTIFGNIDDLDAAIGADSELTALTRTVGPVSTANTVYANLDALDLAVGADASLTAVTRTVGQLSTSADIYTSLDDLDAAIGADSDLVALTRTTGGVSTSSNVYANLDSLDTAVGADSSLTADLTNLGVTTVGTGVDVMGNLNALAKRGPSQFTSSSVTTETSVDSVKVDYHNAVKWMVTAAEDSLGTESNKECVEIFAIHDGTSAADATAVDFVQYGNVKTADISGLTFNVDISGTGASQEMRLTVTSTTAVDVTAIRISV